MKISLTHAFFLVITILLISMLAFGIKIHARLIGLMNEPKIADEPYEPVQNNSHVTRSFIRNFNTELESGIWKNYFLGPSSFNGGYVVDITPLVPSVDGAHVEYKLLPVYDGEQWNDVLSMIFPEQADPLKVNVKIYAALDWPVVFQETLKLQPGDWQGYILQDACIDSGYVIEINPIQPAGSGATLEKAVVQPEFNKGRWYDVLRMQIAENQQAMEAQVRVYHTPDLPVAAEYNARLEPGVWHGFPVGPSVDRVGYVIEVTPLDLKEGYIKWATVQPEFDGHYWNDVARVMIPEDSPGINVHIKVYAVRATTE